MDLYPAVLLVVLLGEYALNLAADLLNLRASRGELPPVFRGVHDAESYRRAQEYGAAGTRFGVVARTVRLAAFLAFWGLGGFGLLDEWTRGLGWSAVPTGLAFVGALLAAQAALDLPLSLWRTFRLEERFGFNRTTPAVFWVDRAKGLVLAILLGGPLLAGILWVFERAGSGAWLWGWGLTTLFLLGVQLVAPTWILPLFNRFEPLPDGPLKERLLGYARRVSFPLQGVFVMDGSRRSSKSNAFFTGFGERRRIALFDTLVERHTEDELVGVLAHEVGHYKRGHIPRFLVLGIVQTGLLFALLALFLEHPEITASFGVQPSTHTALVFFALFATPLQLLLSIAGNAYSRRCELEADAYAAETTATPQALSSALVKLSADNYADLTPHPFYVWLHHSHPPVLKRLEALKS